MYFNKCKHKHNFTPVVKHFRGIKRAKRTIISGTEIESAKLDCNEGGNKHSVDMTSIGSKFYQSSAVSRCEPSRVVDLVDLHFCLAVAILNSSAGLYCKFRENIRIAQMKAVW